jgi:putative transposase
MAGVSLGFAQQCAELPACKDVRPELAEVNAQVLQNVVKRVDLAFQAFFGGAPRVSASATPAIARGPAMLA